MNNEDIIRQKIEQADPEGNISQAVVEELVASMTMEIPKIDLEIDEEKKTGTEILREEMNNTKDWREKASIAAKIISMNLS